MAADTTYKGILLGGAGTSEGFVTIGSKGFQWRSAHTDRVISISKGGLRAAEWVTGRRAASLRLTTTKGSVVLLDQFRGSDKERVAAGLESAIGCTLTDGRVGTTGANFGTIRMTNSQLEFKDASGSRAASLPLSALAQVMAPARHELELQLQEDDTVEREDEALVEVRLYIPPSHGEVDDAAAAGAEDEDADGAVTSTGIASGRVVADAGEREDGATPAAMMRTQLTRLAGIQGAVGDAIAEFPESVGAFLAPRGRFAVEVYPSFLRLVGKSTEFKIAHAKISRMYYLPKPGSLKDEDDKPVPDRFYFIISLHDPIRQGQQRYPHLVMLLPTDEFECRLNLSPEQLKAKGMPPVIRDTLPMVFATVLKQLTGKKIFRSQQFESFQGHKAVRCALKSNEGFLYPLRQGLFFVFKPPCFIRYADIETVTFSRIGAGSAGLKSRTFDMLVHCRGSGTEAPRDYAFSSMERAEYAQLKLFLHERALSIVTDEGDGDGRSALQRLDAAAEAGAASMALPKNAGKTKSKRAAGRAAAAKSAADQIGAAGGDGDDDDDDNDDGDFGAAESESSSSDDDDDDDADGDDADSKGAGKRPRGGDDDDEDDEDGDDDESGDEDAKRSK